MKKRLVGDFWPYEAASLVHEEADVLDIIKHFAENPCLHHVCVVDKEERLLGLINRKRIFKSVFSHFVGTEAPVSSLFTLLTAQKSEQLMVTHIISSTQDATIDSAVKLLIEHNIREVPVINEDQRVLGFITISMILQEWVKSQSAE